MENNMTKTYNKVVSYLLNNPELFKSTDREIQDIINWYRTVDEYNLYLLNKTKITLIDLQQYMLKRLHTTPTHNGYYDEDGYAGQELIFKIKNFWENIDDKKFEYFITGEFATDELDLTGGRFYLIDISFIVMLFNYIYYNLGWTREVYENKIFNSLEFTDDILSLFPPQDISPLERQTYYSYEDVLKEVKRKRIAYEKAEENLEKELSDKIEFDFSIEYMQSDGFCITNYDTSDTAPIDKCLGIIKKKGHLSTEDHQEIAI